MGISRTTVAITSILTTASLWLGTQVYKTREVINNAIDTGIYDAYGPQQQKKEEKDGNYISIKLEESRETRWDNFWANMRFFYARRLLSLAGSDHSEIRTRAVHNLAKLNTLKSWQYTLLEQMCEAPVAVSLARVNGVDERFFSAKPKQYLPSNSYVLMHVMKEYLTFLSQSTHLCMKNFLTTAFEDESGVGYFYDSDASLLDDQITRAVRSSPDRIPVCLQSVLHHSSMEPYVHEVAAHNGLGLLMEVYQHHKENKDVAITICNILANVSSCEDMLEEMFRTGWINVLAAWSSLSTDNIRLSVPAARALANLDRDDVYHCTYTRNVHLLHPTAAGFAASGGGLAATSSHAAAPAQLDVVFVHGLLGGALHTWRQRDRDSSEIGIGLIESITSDSYNVSKLLRSSDPNVQDYICGLEDLESEEYDNVGQGFEYVLYDLPVHASKDAGIPYCCSRTEFCSSQQSTTTTAHLNQQPTQCWPRDWLPADCTTGPGSSSSHNSIRVLGLHYDTSLSLWAGLCPEEALRTPLEVRAADLLEQLVTAGVGARPVLFVCHSMGGLLVKHMLVMAFENGSDEMKKFAENTKGIVFYSTPHKGSSFASLNTPTSLVVMPSIEVRELREESEKLKVLHSKFLDLLRSIPMEIISFVETKSTIISAMKISISLVNTDSANIGIGEYYEIPQDHQSICKPFNRQSFLYQRVVRLVSDILTKMKREEAMKRLEDKSI